MTPTVREVVIALIMAVVSAGGVYYQLQGDMRSADVSQTDRFLTRMEKLEARIDVLQSDLRSLAVENAALEAENTQLTVKVGILQAKLNYGAGTDIDTIFELLESLDVPAWCKVWINREDKHGMAGHFEMGYINSPYEFTYGVTRERYVGSTDFDVHPVQVAQAFTENDLRTFSVRGWIDYTESVKLPDGSFEQRRFWKFYHQLGDGPEMVCGWEVP